MNQLLEKTRNELIRQPADKTKSYGTTRLIRSNKIKFSPRQEAYNRCDMNALFKAGLMSFIIPVQGETDVYEVEILFQDIDKAIQREVRGNNYKLEYKCIYKAILKAINTGDVLMSCSCSDWKYRFAHWATKGRYNSGESQLIPAKITNPNNTLGAGCKHSLAVMNRLDWALKLATMIYNYIVYMRDNYERKYYDIMFPTIYGMTYDRAVQMDLFDDGTDELPDTIDSEGEDAAWNQQM